MSNRYRRVKVWVDGYCLRAWKGRDVGKLVGMNRFFILSTAALLALQGYVGASSISCSAKNIDPIISRAVQEACKVINSAKTIRFTGIKAFDIPRIDLTLYGDERGFSLGYDFNVSDHQIDQMGPSLGYTRRISQLGFLLEAFRQEVANAVLRAGDSRAEQVVRLPMTILLIKISTHEGVLLPVDGGGQYNGEVDYLSPANNYTPYKVGNIYINSLTISSVYTDLQGHTTFAKEALKFLGLRK